MVIDGVEADPVFHRWQVRVCKAKEASWLSSAP